VYCNDTIPVRLLLLERRYTQELIDGRLRIVAFGLLGVVVFVLDVDVAALFFVIVLKLEVISGES
jgi:hypothetical protein